MKSVIYGIEGFDITKLTGLPFHNGDRLDAEQLADIAEHGVNMLALNVTGVKAPFLSFSTDSKDEVRASAIRHGIKFVDQLTDVQVVVDDLNAALNQGYALTMDNLVKFAHTPGLADLSVKLNVEQFVESQFADLQMNEGQNAREFIVDAYGPDKEIVIGIGYNSKLKGAGIRVGEYNFVGELMGVYGDLIDYEDLM